MLKQIIEQALIDTKWPSDTKMYYHRVNIDHHKIDIHCYPDNTPKKISRLHIVIILIGCTLMITNTQQTHKNRFYRNWATNLNNPDSLIEINQYFKNLLKDLPESLLQCKLVEARSISFEELIPGLFNK